MFEESGRDAAKLMITTIVIPKNPTASFADLIRSATGFPPREGEDLSEEEIKRFSETLAKKEGLRYERLAAALSIPFAEMGAKLQADPKAIAGMETAILGVLKEEILTPYHDVKDRLDIEDGSSEDATFKAALAALAKAGRVIKYKSDRTPSESGKGRCSFLSRNRAIV